MSRRNVPELRHIGLVERRVGGFDGDPAAVRHRVARIHHEIDDRIVEMARVGERRPQPGGEHGLDLDRLADRADQHVRHVGDRPVDVEPGRRERLLAGEGKQLLGQRRSPSRPLGRRLHRPRQQAEVGRGSGVDSPPDRVQIADHDREQVVEIMRDACGELADELELLRLQQPRFGLQPARRLGFQRVRLRAQLLDVGPARRHHSRRGDHGEGEAQEREPEQERLELLGVELALAQKLRLLGVEIEEERVVSARAAPCLRPAKATPQTVAGSESVLVAARSKSPMIGLDQAVDLVDPIDLRADYRSRSGAPRRGCRTAAAMRRDRRRASSESGSGCGRGARSPRPEGSAWLARRARGLCRCARPSPSPRRPGRSKRSRAPRRA